MGPETLSRAPWTWLLSSKNDPRPHLMFHAVAFATNNRRHGLAMRRAILPARTWRALSVAMPVFAYIWRYSLEISICIWGLYTN
jgi:hypothetical protein